MCLLKSPSPLRIATNRRSRPGFGIRRSGFEKKEGTGLAEEGRRQGSGLRDSRGVTVNLRGQSVDSAMVVSQVVQSRKPRLAELKGLIELTGHAFSERWTTFSDLLIQKGLLSRRRWRGGEPLLNLKDLLAVLQPSLKRVFENGPILTPLILCRIVPNSAIFCQNVAEYGIKSTFFATDFIRTGRTPAAREPSQRGPNTNWPAEGITRAPHTYLPAGGHRISPAGRWLVTDMVKPRKLMEAFDRHFPHPSATQARRPLLQAKGLLERVSVFGRFLGYQILPNFTNFYQKRAANGLEQADKG